MVNFSCVFSTNVSNRCNLQNLELLFDLYFDMRRNTVNNYDRYVRETYCPILEIYMQFCSDATQLFYPFEGFR
jgi:hypothetical protein